MALIPTLSGIITIYRYPTNACSTTYPLALITPGYPFLYPYPCTLSCPLSCNPNPHHRTISRLTEPNRCFRCLYIICYYLSIQLWANSRSAVSYTINRVFFILHSYVLVFSPAFEHVNINNSSSVHLYSDVKKKTYI